MKFSLTRDEVVAIVREHFKPYGEVKDVRITSYGDSLIEATIATPLGLADTGKPAHKLESQAPAAYLFEGATTHMMSEVRKKRQPIESWVDAPWGVTARLYRFEGTDSGAVVTDGAVCPVGDHKYTIKEVGWEPGAPGPGDWVPGEYYRTHLSPIQVEQELDYLAITSKCEQVRAVAEIGKGGKGGGNGDV